MIEPAFDENRLATLLAALQSLQQLAFGAACCERILPNYSTFKDQTGWGDPKPLRRALDIAWQACAGKNPVREDVEALLVQCEAETPDSDDFDSLYTSSAQDAAFAVCSLLDFVLRKEVGCVVNAARYPADSIDLIVQERENLQPQDSELERKILEHPLMQQELLRQKRDLAEVQRLAPSDQDALLAFSARAQVESAFSIPE